MSYLRSSLRAWNTSAFAETLAREVAQLGNDALPLQQGLSQGSVALDDDLTAIVTHVSDEPGHIFATIGICYSGTIAGCNCSDDPTPDNRTVEYCTIRLAIDKATAETTITLLPEQGG
jgi:hypothetical protein